MKRSTKAALLSGLLFPGLGQFYLKRHLRGLLLALGTAAALWFAIAPAVRSATELATQIESGAVAPDPDAIAARVAADSAAVGRGTGGAMIAVLALWLAGIADAALLAEAGRGGAAP